MKVEAFIVLLFIIGYECIQFNLHKYMGKIAHAEVGREDLSFDWCI